MPWLASVHIVRTVYRVGAPWSRALLTAMLCVAAVLGVRVGYAVIGPWLAR